MSFLRKKYAELGRILIAFGLFLCALAIILFYFTFKPVIGEEIKYIAYESKKNPAAITPVNTDFAIVIPKLGANAPVVAKVDPFRESEYQFQLTKGVAHAEGTALPGENGTVFLFAHSAVDFYKANQYNAVFYLLYKLQKNDDIYVYFKNTKFHYKVAEQKYVEETDIQYLFEKTKDDRLILMTCWPPGTTLQRLLIFAEPAQ